MLLWACPGPQEPSGPHLDALEPAHVRGGEPFVLTGSGANLDTVRAVRIGPHRISPTLRDGRLVIAAPALPRGEYAVTFEPPVAGPPWALRVDNSPPKIGPVLRQLVRPGQQLRIPIARADFDGDPLRLTVSPPASVAPAKDSLQFTATASLSGTLVSLTASVSDGRDTASMRVLIEVRDVVAAPRIDLVDPEEIAGGAPGEVEVYGAGFDAGAVVELDGAPLLTEVRGATLLVAEVPAHRRGRVRLAVIGAGGRSNEAPLDVGNAPPALQFDLHNQVSEGARLEIRLAATDLDGDPVRIFATDLPPGARFDPVRNTVEMTPDFIQGGARYEARAVATDGESWSEAPFFVDVIDTVQPPWPEVVGVEARPDHVRLTLSQITDDYLDSPAHAGRRFEARVSVPKQASPEHRLPVRVFLHGLGGKPYAGGKGDAFRIYPHDPDNTYWWGYSEGAPTHVAPGPVLPYTARRVLHLVEWVLKEHPGADPEQVYLHGTSMGGAGAASIGLLWPHHFAFVEAMIGQTVARNHRPSRIAQLSGHWGALQDNLPSAVGLPVWDRLDLVRALAEEPAARDQFVFSRHGKDDPIIHFGAAVIPSPRVHKSWLEALEDYRVGHLAVWDEGGHGPPDPVLGKDWWTEGWDRARDRHTRLYRNQAFVAFSRCTANEAPGDGEGNGKQDWHEERGFAGDVDVPGDTGWRGDLAGTLNRYLRWDTNRLVDTPERFSVPLRAALGTGRPPPEADYPARGARYDGPVPLRADVTPRRVQAFHLRPDERVRWRFGDLRGEVRADAHGVVTLEALPIGAEWTTLTLDRP